jgi:hypothetical protein
MQRQRRSRAKQLGACSRQTRFFFLWDFLSCSPRGPMFAFFDPLLALPSFLGFGSWVPPQIAKENTCNPVYAVRSAGSEEARLIGIGCQPPTEPPSDFIATPHSTCTARWAALAYSCAPVVDIPRVCSCSWNGAFPWSE